MKRKRKKEESACYVAGCGCLKSSDKIGGTDGD